MDYINTGGLFLSWEMKRFGVCEGSLAMQDNRHGNGPYLLGTKTKVAKTKQAAPLVAVLTFHCSQWFTFPLLGIHATETLPKCNTWEIMLTMALFGNIGNDHQKKKKKVEVTLMTVPYRVVKKINYRDFGGIMVDRRHD